MSVRMRKWLKRLAIACAASLVLVLLTGWLGWLLPFWGMPLNFTRHGRVPVAPAWALECWLWEDDVNTAAYVLELLDGYEKHDLPVGTILIDSPWSTRYNDFIVDEERYPNPEAFFTGLQNRGYRVVLWMTSLVNSEGDDTAITESADWYEDAKSKGYLAGDGHQLSWWKGTGGFIDYANPEAMTWWRGLQQQVFDWGLDGWKLDGAATYFSAQLSPVPIAYQKTHGGLMTTRGYMDHYYRDEYQHGLTQNPEFITLSRAIDRHWHPEGFAPLDAAPVTWVGDQDHAWTLEDEGIEEALTDILRSAKLGYCVIGSDVAGFSGREIPKNLYIRWAQFSTFCGLFLNGGHGERALWKRSEEELQIIRTFSWLHTELVPYIYSHVVACHNGGKPLMRPMKAKYHYLFGDDFLVAPIYEDSPTREVSLPKGMWRYFFDTTKGIEGPATFTRDFPLDEFPVYIRDGAIIPLDVKRAYTGLGDRDSEGLLTLLIYPTAAVNTFTVHHPDGSGQTAVTTTSTSAEGHQIALEGVVPRHILRVFSGWKPAAVRLDGQEPMEEGREWSYDEKAKLVVIRSRESGSRYELLPGESTTSNPIR